MKGFQMKWALTYVVFKRPQFENYVSHKILNCILNVEANKEKNNQ